MHASGPILYTAQTLSNALYNSLNFTICKKRPFWCFEPIMRQFRFRNLFLSVAQPTGLYTVLLVWYVFAIQLSNRVTELGLYMVKVLTLLPNKQICLQASWVHRTFSIQMRNIPILPIGLLLQAKVVGPSYCIVKSYILVPLINSVLLVTLLC